MREQTDGREQAAYDLYLQAPQATIAKVLAHFQKRKNATAKSQK
jgi:hypothetical protein